MLLPSEVLKDQFNARLISILVDMLEAEQSANQNDWFDAPAPEEIENEPINEAVRIDLLEISEKFLPNFRYKEEVEKGFVNTTDMKQRSKRSVSCPLMLARQSLPCMVQFIKFDKNSVQTFARLEFDILSKGQKFK